MITEEFQAVKDRLDKGDTRMTLIEASLLENKQALQENTDLTKEIKEILDLGKTFFKLLKYIGVIAKWLTVLGSGLAVIWAVAHGQTPPK